MKCLAALILGIPLVLVGCGGNAGSAAPTDSSNNVDQSQDSRLNGTYAFAVTDQGCACRFAAAGSFAADGAGNITSGTIDVNSDAGIQTAITVTGKYNVGKEGRGTATLNAANASYQFRFVTVNSKRAFVIGFDTHQNASGAIEKQDASGLSNSALTGGYVFHLYGTDGFGEATEMIGAFNANGAGGISSGVADLHDNQNIATNLSVQAGSTLQLSGTNGRGVAKIVTSAGALDLAVYAVDAGHLKVISTDQQPVVMGDIYRQASASLNGAYAFTVHGWSEGQPLPAAAGGVFHADGAGNISGGTEDTNNNGTVAQQLTLSGHYSMATNGRGTATLSTSSGSATYALYPSANGIEMMEIDANAVAGGTAYAQQGAPFSVSSLNGTFALTASGFTGNNSDELATLSLDGRGNLSGTMDLNVVGAPQSGLTVSGSYTFAGDSGSATLKTSARTDTVGLYPVSSSRVLTLTLESNAVLTGSLEQQQ